MIPSKICPSHHSATAPRISFNEVETIFPPQGERAQQSKQPNEYPLAERVASRKIKQAFHNYLQNLRQTAERQGAEAHEKENRKPAAILPAIGYESALRLEQTHFNSAFYQLSPYVGAEESGMKGAVTFAAVLSSIERDETPNQEVAQIIQNNGEVLSFRAYIPQSIKDYLGHNPDLHCMEKAARELGFETATQLAGPESDATKKQTLSDLRHALIQHINNPLAQLVLYFNGEKLGRRTSESHFAVAAAYDPKTDSVLVMDPADQQGHFWTPLSRLHEAMRPEKESGKDSHVGIQSDKGWLVISKPDAEEAAAAIRFDNAFPATHQTNTGRSIKILPYGIHRKESITRFTRSMHGSFDQINHLLNHQQALTKCGIASACAVLNSFRPGQEPRYSQDNFLDDETDAIKHRAHVVPADPRLPFTSLFPGLALHELTSMLVTKEERFNIKMVYADHAEEQQGAAALRKTLQETIDDPNAHVIVNFNGRDFGRKTGGHFSVAGAYDKASDSVLIMDPAGHRHQDYFWVSVSDLYHNMQGRTGIGLPRGYLVVSHAITQEKLEALLKAEGLTEKANTSGKDFYLGKFLEEKGYSRNISGMKFNKEKLGLLKGMKPDGLTFTNCEFDHFQPDEVIRELANCHFRNCVFSADD